MKKEKDLTPPQRWQELRGNPHVDDIESALLWAGFYVHQWVLAIFRWPRG